MPPREAEGQARGPAEGHGGQPEGGADGAGPPGAEVAPEGAVDGLSWVCVLGVG